MQVQQALRALSQMREAAPPATSAKLGDMITLVRQLEAENAALSRQLAERATAGQPIGASPLADLMPPAFAALRSMLGVVRDQTLTLVESQHGRAAPDVVERLQEINDHSNSAAKLIASLEEIALLRQGAFQLEPLVFSGLDLLADAWQNEHKAADERDQHISVYADDPLPYVLGDYRAMVSVLGDLLDNAIHYTAPGKSIRMTAETLGTHVLFSIADEGVGLSGADHDQIGQPYWRALRHPLVQAHPGAGLRLHIAQQVLALHESELLFSGEPGVGSTFSFTLGIS